eukprot:CAMPEP_0197559550 /NCGR_PEP_ID=MMETSP1320-20131121/21472_1 /TAXON_ID=91990 /ORGANISM="Bolidomonas sp., Strain RCC2347" /LENGTH=131 /DNA_ID=CAMNT_0043121001 /DNA_START=133 /DNA_END=524 /DNA_ORIENTATION=+
MSAYEQLREANIARNNARLDSLGLLSDKRKISEAAEAEKKKGRKRKKAPPAMTPPTRRSSRASVKPDRIQVGYAGYYKAERSWGGGDDDEGGDETGSDEDDDEAALLAKSKSEEALQKMRSEMALHNLRIT